MKLFVGLAVAVLALFTIACGSEGSTPDPTEAGVAEDPNSPASVVSSWVKDYAIERGLLIVPGSLHIAKAVGDRQSVEVHVTVTWRLDPNSAPLEQEATLDVRNPTGEGWIVYGLEPWENTTEQEEAVQATEAVYAQATQEAEALDRQEARRLIEVGLPETATYINGPVFIPVVFQNNHGKDHTVSLRAAFRFPEGEVINTQSFDRTLSAYSTWDDNLQMLGDGDWPDLSKYLPSRDAITGEVYNAGRPEITLISWSLVIDGEEGEIHQIGG